MTEQPTETAAVEHARRLLATGQLPASGGVGELVRTGALMFEPYHHPELATELLHRAIRLDPVNTHARFWLAKCLYHDYVDAQSASIVLQDLLRLDPTRADALSLMVSVLGELGTPTIDRIPFAVAAVEQAPEWVLPRFQLAQLLRELGRTDEAEAQAAAALNRAEGTPIYDHKDTIQQYYESAVTGRASPTLRNALRAFLEELRRPPAP
jgi:tetratricopeptide (TPR) repeat protein